MIKKIWGFRNRNDNEEELVSRYGHIDTNFFHYVTPGMIISVVMLVGGIASAFTMIKGYFMHNPPLNGALMVCEIVGLLKAFGANVSIFNTARFLKHLETIENKQEFTTEDVASLRADLEKRAHLLSMAPISTALANLEKYGHLNIKDDTARLIKSKLGSRIAHLRSNVNYFCGIMVMMGLIGTFWGLLRTISDVGGAMTKISDSMGGGGQLDMGEFLQSISKPLEGMGIGFSASLFGLGGSLFLGFFNYIATYVHDHFIENFGRWLDNRIVYGSTSIDTKQNKPTALPGADDLKAWLAGFVYLAKESNKRMSQLFTAFADANKINSKNLQQIENLYLRQNEVLKAIELGNQKLTGIHNTLKSFAEDAASQHASLTKLHMTIPQLADAIISHSKVYQSITDSQASRLDNLLKHAQQLSQSLIQVGEGQNRLEQSHALLADSLSKQSDTYRETAAGHIQQLALLTGQLQQWAENTTQMGDIHSGLLQEIKDIKRAPADAPHVAEISSLVVQVNALLEEIGTAGDDGLLEVFRKNMTPEAEFKDTDA